MYQYETATQRRRAPPSSYSDSKHRRDTYNHDVRKFRENNEIRVDRSNRYNWRKALHGGHLRVGAFKSPLQIAARRLASLEDRLSRSPFS